MFPEESGIDLDRIPAPANSQPQGVADVLSAPERWGGSDSRRVLRGFLSRFLTGQLRLGLPALPPGHRALTDSGSGYFRGLHWRRLKHDGHLF